METLRVYRDDGLLADLLAGTARPAALGPVPMMLVAVGVLGSGLVVDGAASGPATVFGVVGFLLLGLAVTVGVPHARIQWLVPPLLRTAEYALVIVLAWRAGPHVPPVAYALLAALAFHHYDIVYRLRHQRIPPPSWVRWLGGGWEVRILVITAAAVFGASEPVMLAVAVWCAVLFVGESMVSWISVARDERRTVGVAIDEDDEAVD